MLRDHYKQQNQQLKVKKCEKCDIKWTARRMPIYRLSLNEAECRLIGSQLRTSTSGDKCFTALCMSENVKQVLIWGLQIYISEWLNSQTENPLLSPGSFPRPTPAERRGNAQPWPKLSTPAGPGCFTTQITLGNSNMFNRAATTQKQYLQATKRQPRQASTCPLL